jgi:hypothetical protein
MKISKTVFQLTLIQMNAIQLMGGQVGDQKYRGVIPEDMRDSKAFLNFKKFISKTVEKPLAKINEERQDLALEHALEIGGKLQRTAAGEFEYSKEGQKALLTANRALNEKQIEVDYDRENQPWSEVLALIPEVTKKMWRLSNNDDLKEAFEGFYVEESVEEAV